MTFKNIFQKNISGLCTLVSIYYRSPYSVPEDNPFIANGVLNVIGGKTRCYQPILQSWRKSVAVDNQLSCDVDQFSIHISLPSSKFTTFIKVWQQFNLPSSSMQMSLKSTITLQNVTFCCLITTTQLLRNSHLFGPGLQEEIRLLTY